MSEVEAKSKNDTPTQRETRDSPPARSKSPRAKPQSRIRIVPVLITLVTVVVAALLGWTFDLAVRLGAEGIRVNSVVPGYVAATEFFGDRMTDERHQRLVGRTPLGRAGTPDDIAGCVFFLASDDAAYVTGQLLHVNGGALLRG